MYICKKFSKDYKGAIDDSTKAIELDPENPDTYISWAHPKSLSGDYQGAIDDSTKAIELDPENSESYISRAHPKSLLGDYKGAIDDYSKALELAIYERDKKEILELRSKAYQMLSKIDLDNSQSL